MTAFLVDCHGAARRPGWLSRFLRNLALLWGVR